MAALPFIFRRVFTCWRKLSCLLLVVAQKSWRSYVRASLSALPSPFVSVMLLFLPKGGLVITMSYRVPGSLMSESPTSIGIVSPLMPCR